MINATATTELSDFITTTQYDDENFLNFILPHFTNSLLS